MNIKFHGREVYNYTGLIINQDTPLRSYRMRDSQSCLKGYINVGLSDDVVLTSENRVFLLTVNTSAMQYRYIDVTNIGLDFITSPSTGVALMSEIYNKLKSTSVTSDAFRSIYSNFTNDHLSIDWSEEPLPNITYLSSSEFKDYIFNPTVGHIKQTVDYLYLLSQ